MFLILISLEILLLCLPTFSYYGASCLETLQHLVSP